MCGLESSQSDVEKGAEQGIRVIRRHQVKICRPWKLKLGTSWTLITFILLRIFIGRRWLCIRCLWCGPVQQKSGMRALMGGGTGGGGLKFLLTPWENADKYDNYILNEWYTDKLRRGKITQTVTFQQRIPTPPSLASQRPCCCSLKQVLPGGDNKSMSALVHALFSSTNNHSLHLKPKFYKLVIEF